VYAGTVSESLARGCGSAGWRCPARAVPGAAVSALDELALAELITSGCYDQQSGMPGWPAAAATGWPRR
jgi:hypothetical protein